VAALGVFAVHSSNTVSCVLLPPNGVKSGVGSMFAVSV
jgi:hypothetical protein